MKGLIFITLVSHVAATCTSAVDCSAASAPAASVCTQREAATQCTSIAQGSGSCVTYARPGTPFLP